MKKDDQIPDDFEDGFYHAVKVFRNALEVAGVDVESRQVHVFMPMEDMKKLINHYGMEKTQGIFETLRIQFKGIGK